jgi:predicted ATP-dependent protease
MARPPKNRFALPPSRLRLKVSPRGLSAAEAGAAAKAAPLILNQERAKRSIEFALGMRAKGYHLFVVGVVGTGKHNATRRLIEAHARRQPPPDDLLYVHNFRYPDRPTAVLMPAGQGRHFVEAMERFVAYMRDSIPKALESKEHEDQKQAMLQRFEERRKEVFARMEEDGSRLGFQVQRTEGGIVAFPLVNGQPIAPADFAQLPPEEKSRIEEKQKELNGLLRDHFRSMRDIDRQAEEDVRELDRYVLNFLLEPQTEALHRRFGSFPRAADYLHDVEQDVKRNLQAFMERSGEAEPASPAQALSMVSAEDVFRHYRVNLAVDNSSCALIGAPVIRENNPSYSNLFGRMEKIAIMGAAHTDFTLIKAGSLFHANGGFLFLNADEILRHPLAWNALKTALIQREAMIEDIAELRMPVTMSALKPEPVPLRVKIVLFGSPEIFQLLYHYDEAFRKIFKVKADFEPDIPFHARARRTYAQFLHRMAADRGFSPIEAEAVAALMEFGARLAGHQGKLSLRLTEVGDLAREAAYWAGLEKAKSVRRKDVDRAVEERERRTNFIADRMRQAFAEGVYMVSTRGAEAGQINGLSVYDFGHYSFGRPVRITAAARMGEEGIVDIERRVRYGRASYEKGVLILAGFLGERFARDKPLALHCSITFEQSYSEIDGDSASMAELMAILSAISRQPIRQGIAITGSVNQKGEAQAIGGVNEKIEGYYEVCKDQGLTGEQGVVIPRANVQHLMLKPEVVEAVRKGRFRVYAVRHADEAAEILMGLRAGRRGKDGHFPSGTLNAKVDKALWEMAMRMRMFGGEDAAGKGPFLPGHRRRRHPRSARHAGNGNGKTRKEN